MFSTKSPKNRIEQDIQKFSSLKSFSKQTNGFDNKNESKLGQKSKKEKVTEIKSLSKQSDDSESDEQIELNNEEVRDIVPHLDSDVDDASSLNDNGNEEDLNQDEEENNQSSSDAENEDFDDDEMEEDFSGDDVLFGGKEPADAEEDSNEDDDGSEMVESDEEDKFLTEDKAIDEKETNLMFDDFFEPPTDQSHADKSNFELSQKKLQEDIDKLEEMMMDEKPWRLRGEIDAVDRDENTVLEEDLDTRYAALEKPEVSEDVETTLLNLIKTKIKSRDFDNVERKSKQQIQDERSYRKLLELNSDKPKPLHEVYEEDYYKKNNALIEENEDPQKEKIRKEMNALFADLDALSSLRFVPRAALPDVKIIQQIPATQIEEVAPVTASTADLLAPEEVLANPSRPLVGESEMTQADRKRKHRKIKKHFHEKKIARIEKFGTSKKKSLENSSKSVAMTKVMKMAHKPNSNIKIVK